MTQGFVPLLTETGLPFFDLGANGGMTAVSVLGAAGVKPACPVMLRPSRRTGRAQWLIAALSGMRAQRRQIGFRLAEL